MKIPVLINYTYPCFPRGRQNSALIASTIHSSSPAGIAPLLILGYTTLLALSNGLHERLLVR